MISEKKKINFFFLFATKIKRAYGAHNKTEVVVDDNHKAFNFFFFLTIESLTICFV